MKNILSWIKNNFNRTMFLFPIVLTMVVSISHVITWYSLSNPFNWAIFMSLAIEIGAMAALMAATNKIKGGVWFMFGIITLIQMIGNIFYSYNQIDATSKLFISWVELTSPLFEVLGSDVSDISNMKRWLAFLEGGLLPVISLTSLHFFVKYEKPKVKNEEISVTQDVLEKNLYDLNVDFEKEDILTKQEDLEKKVEVESIEKNTASKENFEKLVEEKKKKLEEDKKVFQPLLKSLYKDGTLGTGEILPTYIEFRNSIDSKYTDDNIKMFLTLCNYLDITELSDNVRKSKVDYEEASYILSKYLSLDEKEENNEKIKEEKNNVPLSNESLTQKDWWTKSKGKN
jgi:hypothetical protein